MTPCIHLYFRYKWTICASACHGAPKTVKFFFVAIHAIKSEISWPLGRVHPRCSFLNLICVNDLLVQVSAQRNERNKATLTCVGHQHRRHFAVVSVFASTRRVFSVSIRVRGCGYFCMGLFSHLPQRWSRWELFFPRLLRSCAFCTIDQGRRKPVHKQTKQTHVRVVK